MQYYDFTIDGVRVGYYQIEERSGESYMNARFRVAAEVQENPFWLRHVDGCPMRVKVGGSSWHDVPEGTFPTCAYPFVLRSGLDRYRAFIEGTGEVEQRELRLEAGLVVEYCGENPVRRFGVEEDRISYIWWGGTAESHLVGSRAEAAQGTAFE